MNRFLLTAIAAAIIPHSLCLAATRYVPSQHATIQSAINSSTSGDQIVVAPGTYAEAINFNGKSVVIRSTGGPGATIIDGSGINSSVVKCINGEGPSTRLEGFTITGGSGTLEANRRKGGGMLIRYATPTVRNCIFDDNVVTAYEFSIEGSGAGIYNEMAAPVIEDCIFRNNQLLGCSGWLNGGAGIYNAESSPTIIGCTFEDNFANNGGGIMNITLSNPVIRNCIFRSNSVTFSGGAINSTDYCDPQIINSLFTDNHAWHGAAIYGHSSAMTVTNCTLADDVAEWRGAGLYTMYGNGPAIVANSIFHNNILYWPDMPPGENPPGDEEKEITNTSGPAPQVSYSIVQGGWAGNHVLNVNPQFANAATGDYHVSDTSPAINFGNNGALPPGVNVDLDENPRVVSASVDLGSFEHQQGAVGGCPGDVDGDGVIDFDDFTQLLASWGPCSGCAADFDDDGQVDFDDFTTLLAGWGPCS